MKLDGPADVSCRACLVQRRSLRSLFDRYGDGSHTYADLLRSCANVKIHANDGFSDKICLTCRRKAEEAYDFKILVEESDRKLWFGKNTCVNGIRRLIFNNLIDIKVEIDGCKLENGSENITNDDAKDIKRDFINGAEKIFYNNISIRKLVKTETPEHTKKKTPIDVEDFLNAIVKKEVSEVNCEDEQDDFFDDNWMDQEDDCRLDRRTERDEEYLPPGVTNKKYMEKRKHKKNRKSRKGVKKAISAGQLPDVAQKNVRLEPVILDDVRLAKDAEKQAKKLLTMKKGKPKIKPIFLEDYRIVKTKSDFIRRTPKRPDQLKKKTIPTFICPYCGLFAKNLKSHLLIHTGERSHKCSDCPKAFFTKKQLEHHMLKHGQRNFKCDKCPADFYIKGSLISHLKCHEEVRDLLCRICSKAFNRKSALRRHEIRHSSANKTIKCEMCSMTFFEKTFLRHHMRVHTGERPFKCELCSQPYSYGRDFIRHCLKKHGCRFRGSEVRVMTAEVLQRERERERSEHEARRDADAVRSIAPPPAVDAAAIAAHHLDLQLRILSGELR